MLRCQWS